MPKIYEGLKELAIDFGISMGIVLISKGLLQTISKKSPDCVYFARPPNGANFKGFPSRHTASTFSKVEFYKNVTDGNFRFLQWFCQLLQGILGSKQKETHNAPGPHRSNAWI